MAKPKNYWKKFSNVKKELAPFIKKLGRLPSYRELKKKDLESLYRYGINSFGGVNKVAKKLGVKTYDQSIGRADQDYWTYEKTVIELIKFIKLHKLIYFPTKTDFKKFKRQDLLGAYRKHGRKKFEKDSRIKVKRNRLIKLKFDFARAPKIKKWKEKEVLVQLAKIVENLGYFPSGADLDEMERTDLRGAISRFGGQIKFWKKLDMPAHKKRPKYVHRRKKRTADEVVQEYKSLVKKINHPPSFTDLKKLEMHNLLEDIHIHFGSIIKLCEYLGFKENLFGMYKTRSGSYVRSMTEAIIDNILTHLKVPHSYEGLISINEKRKYKYDFRAKDLNNNDVYIEVWGYPKEIRSGVFGKLVKNYQRKKIEKINIYKKNKYKLLEIEGREILGGTIASAYYKLAKKFRRFKLIQSVTKLRSFDEINFFVYKLYDIHQFELELKKIEKKFGYLPPAQDLDDHGYGAISAKILKLGGYPIIRKKFHLKNKPRKPSKWNKKKIINEIRKLAKKYSHMPKHSQFVKDKKLDLFGAIQKHYGGTRKLAKIYNFKHTNLTTFKDFNTLDKVKKTLAPMLTRENKIPTTSFLKKNSPKGLYSAIDKLGGRTNIGIKLDLELVYPPYKNQKYLLWKLKKIFKNKKTMPQPSEFRTKIRKKEGTDFRIYVYRLGGFKKVAKMFNLKYKDSKYAIGNFKR